MEANYRIAFTMTVPANITKDEARRAVEEALAGGLVRFGFVGVQTTRETMRRQRRLRDIAAEQKDLDAISRATGGK